jgi:hypothetical protein
MDSMVLELGWNHLNSDADRVLTSPEPALDSDVPKDDPIGKTVLAWLRRIIVSVSIGGVSYALTLGIMVLSVVHECRKTGVFRSSLRDHGSVQHDGLVSCQCTICIRD